MNIKYRSYHLAFKHPFTISKGTKTHQPTLVVELEHRGIKGYGEAPVIAYYDTSLEKMIRDIEGKRPFIEKFSFTEPERYWHYLHHLFPQKPFLVCALDMAAWDIYGKMNRKRLYDLWGLNTANNPVTDFTIGLDTPDNMIAKMKEVQWPVYKIKLGTDNDMKIIRELRRHTEAIFRIDANAAWTAGEALEKINVFKSCDVELIEQPLAKDDWEGMKYLFEHSPLPLIADESCVSEHDVQKCYDHFHGINIKLTKCSGLTPAKRMIEKARALGMKVMIGSMNESSIGTAAAAQLLPLVDYADIDGPLLLAEDIARGITFDYGSIVYNNLPGTGVAVEPF